MSLNDLLDVFDELDPLQRGFVTSKEIHQFYSSLVDSPVSEEIVDRVVASICGHGVVEVTQLVFIDILEEVRNQKKLRRHSPQHSISPKFRLSSVQSNLAWHSVAFDTPSLFYIFSILCNMVPVQLGKLSVIFILK